MVAVAYFNAEAADQAADRWWADVVADLERSEERANEMRNEMSRPTMQDVAPAPSTTDLVEAYERIPIEHLVLSKTNPRTHFDEAYLTQLAASIAEKGVLQPILVREAKKRVNGAVSYEIVVGECRYRAAKQAHVTHIPAVIRPYTDEQVLEVQLIENLHRKDLRPLEQAKGFRALIDANPTKHSAESIATRIGMSPAWVWDRMKLLDLVPEAQKILQEEQVTVGHAILIARLKPEDQKRVIAAEDTDDARRRTNGRFDSGLWRNDAGFDFDEDDPANKGKKPGKYDGLKPCSVRELESWINDHIRFDVAQAAKTQPLTFEALAATVAERAAQPGRGKKVIAITFDHFTQPDARSDEERTFGPQSFKFADGQKHTDDYPRRTYTAATCEYVVLGVVAAGDRRGEAFDVCIARDKCQAHWGKEIKAREKNQKLRDSGKGTQAAGREAAAARRKEAHEQRLAQEGIRREARWKVFKPALTKAVHAAADKLPATLPKALYVKVLAHHRLPPKTKPTQLATALLRDAIHATFDRLAWTGDEPRLVVWAKLLGVDVKACEPETKPVQTSGAKAKKKSAKGKAAA